MKSTFFLHRVACWLCFLGGLLLAAPSARAQDKTGFKESAFFKAFAGEWTMDGELTGKEGNVVKFKEEWKAEILGEDTLSVTGKREINGNSQNYTWTFTHNPITGAFEATHGTTENSDTQHFEVSVMDADMKMEMTALLGSGNTRITIADSFPDKDHDTLESTITLTDESGSTTLSGTVKHQRTKKP